MFTEQPDIVWGLIAALLIANVMLLIMNIPLIGLFTRMLTIPLWFLVPAIAAVSAVGVYAVHSTTFDLVLMVALGVLGYIYVKCTSHVTADPGFVLGKCWSKTCVAHSPSVTAIWRFCGKAALPKPC